MICPVCRTEMTRRRGKFGHFLFCPRQYKGCTQTTITEAPEDLPTLTSRIHNAMRIGESPVVSTPIDDFDCTELDVYGNAIELSEDDEDGQIVRNEGEWFSPY